jgi:SulP family sulfate permease
MKFPSIRYTTGQFAGDCLGGAIAALIALPYGLAMATLMGLPPVLGVFTSILTAPITALLGRNPVLIGGTASATVPFIAVAVKQHGMGGAAKVSIVAAVIMMAFCVLRLGRYIQKIPVAVVSGFSCGIGALMVISQLNSISGVKSPIGGNGGSPFAQLIEFVSSAHAIRMGPLFIGLLVVLAAAIITRFSKRAPAPLIAVLIAVVLARLVGIHESEVGNLPLSLPEFVGFSWVPMDVLTVIPSALGLAVVSSVNILITSRVVDHFRGRRHHGPKAALSADAELGAYGIANVCAGIFGAPMSVGIPARSLANVRCGGTTRMSNIMHGVFLLLFLELGSTYIAHIPIAALAGVTVWIGICLLDWSTWRRLSRMHGADAAAFLSTAIAVLLVNAVAAVAIGCVLHAFRSGLRLPFLSGRLSTQAQTSE